MNRREALARLGVLAAGGIGLRHAAADTSATQSAQSVTSAKSAGTLVIAHITDTHITKAYHSEKWVAECLHKIQSHPARPQMILHTGDIIYDSLRTDRSKADNLWKVWQDTIRRENSLPIHYAIGTMTC